jgi:hypothetical protein
MDYFFQNILMEPLLLGVGFFISWVSGRLLRFLRFRRFLRVFGEDTSPNSILICVHWWRAKSGPRDEARFVRQLRNENTLELFGPDDFVALADVKVINEVNSELAKNLGSPAEVVDDQTDIILPETNLICIGSPVCNSHAKTLVERLEGFFTVVPQKETEENPATFCLRDTSSGEEYSSSSDHEYAVVGRIPNNERPGNFHFVVFGIHASGTTAAGRYLRLHWTDFSDAEPLAAVLLKMGRRDVFSAEVSKLYGFVDRKP